MATPQDELKQTPEQEAEHDRREKQAKKDNAKAPDPRAEGLKDEQLAPAAPPPPADALPPKKNRGGK